MDRSHRTSRRAAISLAAVIVVASAAGPAASGVAATDGVVPVTMTLSPSPTSGSPFTFTPGFPTGYVLPAGTICSWELRWGDNASLADLGFVDDTFGSIALRGQASDGFCDPWTLTLPYSQSASWVYSFGIYDLLGTFYDLTSFQRQPTLPRFSGANGAAVGAGIPDSTLPGVWLSMPKGSIIGDRVTATAHAFGGYVMPPNGANWDAYAGSCYCVRFAHATNHALTFTFTATHAGTISVFYNDTGEQTGGNFAGAGVDPKIRSAIRVVLKTPTTVLTRTHFTATATAYGFKGTIVYRWYVDHVRVLVSGRTPSFYLVRTGQRLITVIVTDRYGHRATMSRWVLVHA